MEPSPESFHTPTKAHPLLAMIAECQEDGRPLDALQTLRSAADEQEGVVEVPSDPPSPSAPAVVVDGAEVQHATDSAPPFPFPGDDVDTFAVPAGVMTKRQTTPERIRRHTTRLYGEIHELIDRQSTRSERQRDMLRRDSGAYRRQSSLQALEDHQRRRSSSRTRQGDGRSADGRHRSSAAATTQLPDLYQEFEASRSRHLAAAQAERSAFPPKEASYSAPAASDPDSFSLRFQTISIPNQRRGRHE